MTSWFTIVIPTRNSAPWLQVLLDHYAARGVRPVFLLDERTSDGTEGILQRSGLTVHRFGGFNFTEEIVRMARDVVATPWALWVHDDEVPSDGLFERLRGPPPPEAAQSVAIQRRWVWYEPGEPVMYGRSLGWPDRTGQSGDDHAWRLFRPDQVKFISVMHTEGFLIDRWSRFGPDCTIAHFEWVVRTRAQRLAKLRQYDRYRYGYGIFFHKVYVPEEQPPGFIGYSIAGDTDYSALAQAYFAARGSAPELPPMSLREQWDRVVVRTASFVRRRLGLKEPVDRLGLTPRLEREIVEK